MGRKVGGCCFRGGTAAPHFSAHAYCPCWFWTDHSRTETRVDEHQLVRVETNNFMRVVHLCLIPITGFSVNLASNHCVISLQDSTEHFPSTGTTRAICTRTFNLHYFHTRFLCFISYAYDSQFSTISSIFSSSFFLLYPILIQQILQRAVESLRMFHTTSVLLPRGSSVFRLFPIDIGQKLGGCAPFFGGEVGPHITQCGRGRGLATSVPSGILKHPAVRPQYISQKVGAALPSFSGGRGWVPI